MSHSVHFQELTATAIVIIVAVWIQMIQSCMTRTKIILGLGDLGSNCILIVYVLSYGVFVILEFVYFVRLRDCLNYAIAFPD